MPPKGKKTTSTPDPTADPFRPSAEAAPGTPPSVVVESRAPSPSPFLFANPATPGGFSGFARAGPPTKRPRSDTSYLTGFSPEKEPKSYWVERFAQAAATQENPTMDTLITTITGFLAELQADYTNRVASLQETCDDLRKENGSLKTGWEISFLKK